MRFLGDGCVRERVVLRVNLTGLRVNEGLRRNDEETGTMSDEIITSNGESPSQILHTIVMEAIV